MKTRRKKTVTDPIQLQQKIIYFQSELAKYHDIVKDYENNYRLSRFKKLQEENLQLSEENNYLNRQLQNTKFEFNKRIDDLESQLSTQKQNTESEHYLKLKEKFNQLKEDKLKVEEELALTTNKLSMEQKKLELKISELEKEIIEVQDRNVELDKHNHALKQEIEVLKSVEEEPTDYSNQEKAINQEISLENVNILNELDIQFKELLSQSFDNKTLLDPKAILINELEKRIDKLSKEIEGLGINEDDTSKYQE